MHTLNDVSDMTQSHAIHLQSIDERISMLDGLVNSLTGLESQVQKIVDAAVSDAIKRMDALHQENVPLLKKQ